MLARQITLSLLLGSFSLACATAPPPPPAPNEALEKASAYVEQGRLSEAALLLSTYANTEELSVKRSRLLGIISLRRGQGREALEHLAPIAKSYADDVDYGWDLAKAYILSARAADAWSVLMRCTKLASATQRPDLWLAAGAIALDLSKLEEAKRLYGAILKEQPDHELAFVGRTRAVAMTGALNEAIEQLKERILDHPDHMEVRFLLGNLYVTANLLSKAKKTLYEVVVLDPEHLEARRALGFIQLRLGAFQDAEQNLRHVAKLLNNDPATQNNLGSALLGLKRYDEAAKWVQMAIDSAPDQAILWQNLLTVHITAGRADRAVKVFERVPKKLVAMDPSLESFGQRARLLAVMTELICDGADTHKDLSGTVRRVHTAWKQRGYGTLNPQRLKRWIEDPEFGPDLTRSLARCEEPIDPKSTPKTSTSP